MNNWLLAVAAAVMTALAEASQSSAEKLPPPTKAAALMALVGIAVLGLFLIVVILLGGHWVRRQGSHRRGQSVPPDRAPLQRGNEGAPDNSDVLPASPPPLRGTPTTGDTAAPGETVVS